MLAVAAVVVAGPAFGYWRMEGDCTRRAVAEDLTVVENSWWNKNARCALEDRAGRTVEHSMSDGKRLTTALGVFAIWGIGGLAVAVLLGPGARRPRPDAPTSWGSG